MKKLLLSISVIILFAFYSAFQKKTGVPPVNSDNLSNNILNTGPSPDPQIYYSYKNGTYTGQVVDAYYGYVQVQINIQNGKIVNVAFLQYPNDRNRSIEINRQAMPYLKQEAITAQNSNVDIISGATATSEAFITSLASSLAQAK